ncbi:MAG TPA: prolyl oligopeptidase family serine peptidase, partial [Anaerolineae bacterium]|nr:prolyl oligopeptidase family serine peptidase [Anaerolineae bacterium]
NAVHSLVNGDANENLIFGAIPIKPAAPNLDPNLAAFLGRWEGYDYGPPIAKDHKGVFVVQDISSQGGTAYLWAATNLQYPYWVKQIHFRVVSGAVPTIEWLGDVTGHPSGTTGVFTYTFAIDHSQDAIKGGIGLSSDSVLSGTIKFTHDQTFYVYQDYAKYLESKRIYAKPYQDQSLTQYGQGYLVYLPEGYENQPDKTWPLIFFLHGVGDRGNNILLIAKASPFMMIRANHPLPSIIVAPLLNTSKTYASFPQPYMAGVLAEVLKDYRVDQKRIYLTGMSMGGEAAYRFAIHQPNTFAAVAILTGFDARFNPGAIEQGFVPSTEPLEALKDLPIWALHGENDQNIPVSLAQNTVDGLKQAGVNVRFTILPNHDHDIWTDTYSDPEFYDWLFQHRRP